LVLNKERCSFDCYHGGDKIWKQEAQLAALITDIVLNWDPNNPVDSMLKTAAKHVGITSDELENAIKKSSCGGVFGGNSLSFFFDHNPFGKMVVDRKYERFCLVTYNEKTDKEVDQRFADEDLGEKLFIKLTKKAKESGNGYLGPLCCSPRRFENNKLHFWINTGRSTQIDGWKTQKEIEDYLSSDGKLVDTMKI